LSKWLAIALLLCVPLRAHAASTHSVTLSWTASVDAGVAYNVYRSPATAGTPVSCPTAPGSAWVQVATGVTVLTYTDTAGTNAGSAWCYYATSTLGGLESIPSNLASAVILPGAPSALATVIH